MLKRTNGTTKDATKNECYNEHSLSIKPGCYNERMVHRTMLQRTVFINKIRMLQRTIGITNNATMNECEANSFLSVKSTCYNERMLNEQFLSIKSGC